jgi:hypothetical protein
MIWSITCKDKRGTMLLAESGVMHFKDGISFDKLTLFCMRAW